MGEIDILAGTFGKALASVGGYIACSALMREFLVNHMRTLIFTTALPPINLLWSAFVLERLSGLEKERAHLAKTSALLREGLVQKGYAHPSSSHIIPLMVGENTPTLEKARVLQGLGFHALPVRPPTVPKGTSRIRFSLTALVEEAHIGAILDVL
jgi:8-amino-7-oxononanoate synthase